MHHPIRKDNEPSSQQRTAYRYRTRNIYTSRITRRISLRELFTAKGEHSKTHQLDGTPRTRLQINHIRFTLRQDSQSSEIKRDGDSILLRSALQHARKPCDERALVPCHYVLQCVAAIACSDRASGSPDPAYSVNTTRDDNDKNNNNNNEK